MMKKSKLSARLSAHAPIDKKAMEFIEAAGEIKAIPTSSYSPDLPWLDPMVRTDICKVFTLKISEDYTEKIKYISAMTNKSQQKIVREIVCGEVDKIIAELV